MGFGDLILPHLRIQLKIEFELLVKRTDRRPPPGNAFIVSWPRLPPHQNNAMKRANRERYLLRRFILSAWSPNGIAPYTQNVVSGVAITLDGILEIRPDSQSPGTSRFALPGIGQAACQML